MSIASRQVTKEVNRIIEGRIKEGFIPTVEYIISQLVPFYTKYRVGSPSFQMRQQIYRSIWNASAYNDNLTELYNDITNLYEEMISQFTVVLDDFDFAETERLKLFHQIQSLEDELTNLNLLSNDTTGNVYSVYDNFIDRTKVNLSYTTCEVNTDARMSTIRENQNGISKVDMSHYNTTVNFPILADSIYASHIVSNTISPGSQFGYAFSDSSSVWTQNIRTNTPGKLVVSFIVDLSPGNVGGLEISRIEADAISPHPMTITPLYSTDNINFIALPMGYVTNKKNSARGFTTVWNFSETNMRYVKFVIEKEMEDENSSTDASSTSYLYVIGFKNISFYKMGYDVSSTLYSNAFTITSPTSNALTIDKASISVDQDIQDGTSIDYYLSMGASGVVDPTTYNWVHISPINDPIPTQQQIVDFRQVAFFANVPDIQWNSSSYGTALETYNGISFYKIYEFPYEPIVGSVTLYRGKNDWQVIPQSSVDRVSIFDEAHTFGAGSSVTISHPSSTPLFGEGLIRGSVIVKSDPGSDPGYTYQTPSDYTVNYTNFTISKVTGSTISADTASPRNTVYVDYEYDKETNLPAEYITYVYILNTSGQDINMSPWTQSQIAAGQYTKIETGGILTDVSSLSIYHLSPGWHQILTTGQPYTTDDRFYYVNGGLYLYQLVYKQYAFSAPLKETSWFELKYNTMITDHTKYAIYDYNGDGKKEVIVNYKPQTTGWASGLDLLAHVRPETYVISYKYISTSSNTIYLKAVLARGEISSPLTTPTLNSYTIRLGY
jgi:hypothetical protein